MTRSGVILGAGSLGLLFAYKLNAAYIKTEVWTHTRKQAVALQTDGLFFEEADGGKAHLSLNAHAWAEMKRSCSPSFVILCVKQNTLTSLFLNKLQKLLAPQTPLMVLQNGLGHVQKLREVFPQAPIVIAVTTDAALRIGLTTVRHTGQGEIQLGVEQTFKAHEAVGLAMKNRLLQAGFKTHLSSEIQQIIYKKLLLNAVINPCTAILGVNNGQLIETKERLRVMRSLFEEVYQVLHTGGLLLSKDQAWSLVLVVCEQTRANLSSMLQDILAKRETEIQAINGAIVAMGKELNCETPLNKLVIGLVEALSSL